ncbi:MAG: tripartite tricarboxylate transporter substrate binding protein [Burkholderiaceae bacterium]
MHGPAHPRSRRILLQGAAAACLPPALAAVASVPAVAATGLAASQPLRVIVPFAAGGPSDLVLRAIAPHWQQRTGQPLIIEHRPGAAGTIGAEVASRAAADGLTLLFAPSEVLVNNTALFRDLRYRPLEDFVPIVRIGPVPLVLVTGATDGAPDLDGFSHRARRQRLDYGSWGDGSLAHLLGHALLVDRLRLDAVHVGYRGLGPMLQDLLGGQISAGFVVPPAALQHLRLGRLIALAVTGDDRSAVLPAVPTLVELGHTSPVFRLRQWAALLAPAGVAQARIAQLEAEFCAALDRADVRRALLEVGFELAEVPGSADASKALRAELALVPPLLRELGIVAR